MQQTQVFLPFVTGPSPGLTDVAFAQGQVYAVNPNGALLTVDTSPKKITLRSALSGAARALRPSKLLSKAQPAEVPFACASEEAGQELAPALDGVSSGRQANHATEHTN